jgi:hypothetical protein
MGAETKWRCCGIGHPIQGWGGKKMATEVGKEFSWQDMPLYRLEENKMADTSSAILLPGY